ncbi:MAG: hypothetical protein Q9197_006766 [Variospora fuerteventurae]
MAPMTRRKAAQLRVDDRDSEAANDVNVQIPLSKNPAEKTNTTRKATKTSRQKVATSASAEVAQGSSTSKRRRRTEKRAVKDDRNADPAAGTEQTVSDWVPDLGSEVLSPGLPSQIAKLRNEGVETESQEGLASEFVAGTPDMATEVVQGVNEGVNYLAQWSLVKEDDTGITKEAQSTASQPLDPIVQKRRSSVQCKAPHTLTSQLEDNLEVPGASMPTLTNDIHDIWDLARHDNWVFDSQLSYNQDWRIYEILMPAMRLASLWLTRLEYQAFWTSIVSSPCKLDKERNSWNLESVRAGSSPSPKAQKDLEKRLREIGKKKIHFRFAPLDCTNGQWARTEAIRRRNSDCWRGNTFELGYATTLHDDFMYVPWPNASPPAWKEASTSAKLRFLFLLAVQLTGQLAEVLWLDRSHREREGKGGIVEISRISIDDIEYDNMSHAFERVFFGGLVEVVGGQPGPLCLHELALRLFHEEASSSESGASPLSIHEINARFSSAWWRKGTER